MGAAERRPPCRPKTTFLRFTVRLRAGNDRVPLPRQDASMRRLALLLGTVALLALAGTAAAGPRSKPPPFPAMPAGFTHAEINVTIAGVPHTLILDRGRIGLVGPRNMALRESDGTLVVIPLSAQTIVQPAGLHLTISNLRRGMNVDAMRVDEGAAVRIRIRGKLAKLAGRLTATP